MYQFHDERIDADHDLIILKFESLIQIVSRESYGSRERREIVQMLLSYTSTHFEREELSMRLHQYPRLRDHMLAHAYLQNEFQKIGQSMFEDRPNLLSDIRLLRALFLAHILSYDESLAEWLSNRRSPVRSQETPRWALLARSFPGGQASIRGAFDRHLRGKRSRRRCGLFRTRPS